MPWTLTASNARSLQENSQSEERSFSEETTCK